MFALFALALAATTAAPALDSSVPWWERITVTVDDKGQQQSCRYQTSLVPSATKACDERIAASISASAADHVGQLAKVTFERRFSPGGQLDSGRLQPGDTLLGRRVMFLTFDAAGAVDYCHVVATSGDLEFAYDCEAARKETFRAQGSGSPANRQAFMTVLAYGHTEHIA